MKRSITITFIAIFLTSCVSVEMPDDMISDTIKAGKDVYKDLRGASKKDGDEIVYTYTYVGLQSDSVDSLVSSCLMEMHREATEKLTLTDLHFINPSHEIKNLSSKVIVNCRACISNLP